MNVVTRGIRNALRSPLRSGAIVIMLAISIGLIVSMLVARSGIMDKINDVKSQNATTVTINAAGVRGGFGGGNPLTAAQVKTITDMLHVASVVSTLTDQLGSSDTNLTPSLELGSLGKRFQRFDQSGGASGQGGVQIFTQGGGAMPQARTTVTGTTDPNSVSTNGSKLTVQSGKTIDGSSSDLVALVGSSLASKNNLKAGNTFTAYGKTITVSGIYKTGNTFQDSGIIMPLKTLQTLTSQPGAVATVTATVDSSDNVSSVVSHLQSSLGSAADITSEAQRAEDTVNSLKGISTLATAGVIGAAAAGAIIILLAMIMIVRERRREIGVIKAIGGTNGKVITQFVVEALTITVIGGIIGFGFGVLVSGPMTKSLVASNSSNPTSAASPIGQGGQSQFGNHAAIIQQSGGPGGAFRQLRSNVTDVTATVSTATLLSAAGLTLLIAIIGSAVPAWFIARIRPAEVLRTE